MYNLFDFAIIDSIGFRVFFVKKDLFGIFTSVNINSAFFYHGIVVSENIIVEH